MGWSHEKRDGDTSHLNQNLNLNWTSQWKEVGLKWIYKIKYKFNEEIKKYKVRLIVKGFFQKKDFDFYKILICTCYKNDISKNINCNCCTKKWNLYQIDVNNTFFYGDLYEKVYLRSLCDYSKKETRDFV